jgi:hypothetical protein
MATLTRFLRANATAVAVLAGAFPTTAAAAEPKNDVPFVAASSTLSFAGEPKNVAPFEARTIRHPTAVDRIIAQERTRQGDPFVFGVPRTEPSVVQIVQKQRGFDWGAAGVGGAAALALVRLVAGAAALRHGARQEAHR